ncbi:DUF1287 domain-containing protein [Glaesserella sp.]|uniref:DUF1287 domain-containing protein n=1 Tax=Glaesserella sp. TaxID=2094731 RepID=UPI0035A14B95
MKRMLFACLLFSSTSLWAFSGQALVKDARKQIGVTKFYDATYSKIDYPMGDVPMIKGVCTDVVVRALREQKIDLQQLIHEDMRQHFKSYPNKWDLKSTDKNIDHRRVPNIATYFKRQGYEIKNGDYQTGDIVTWDLGKGLVHIGIVSDNKAGDGTPLIIHNIGKGTQEENILHQFKITGHFRLSNKIGQ